MRNLFLKILFLVLAVGISLAGCSSPASGGDPVQHTITFDSQGGSEVAAITEDK